MKIIESYIKYLKNLSRKIISKAGFENVLPVETKKRNNLFFDFSNFKESLCKSNEISIKLEQQEIYKYFQKCDYYLNNNDDKKLFIGLGLLNGLFNKGGNLSLLNAPLMYALADIEKNEDDSYSLFIDISTYQLNYDLFAKIFDIKIDEENENELMSQEDFIRFQILNKIEEQYIDKTIDNLDVNNNNIVDYIEIFNQLQNSITEFSKIVISTEKFNYNDRILKIKEAKPILKFYDIIFLFSNRVPDELSTYEALNVLSKQRPLKNKLLNNIFENILTNNKIDFENECDITETDIKNIINNYLPISLSEKQKESIIKAWTSNISYIEGPPGTGKSHTISAIMLTAIFLNKSVLLVSHKKAAIDVVKEKIDSILGKEGILYIGSEDKSATKAHINLLLDNIPSKRMGLYKKDLYEELNFTIENFLNELTIINNDLEVCNKEYKHHLNKENEFYILFQNFLKKRYEFNDIYNPNEFKDYKFNKSKLNLEAYSKAILKYKTSKTSNKRINYFYIIKFLKYVLNNFEINISKAKENPIYINDVILLNSLFADSYQILKKLNSKVTRDLKKKIDYLKEIKNNLIIKNIENYFFLKKLQKLNSDNKDYIKDSMQIYRGMLHYKNPQIVSDKMRKVDFYELIKIFPLWCSELRNLGSTLPMEPEMFDIVIVDEASQVNIAEIIPAFYRGKKLCIVGDDKQLHLNATGVGFSVSKSFDRLIWNSEMGKIKEFNKPIIDFEKAKLKKLIVTESSILEFISAEENDFYIPITQLEEHFRSLPLLANFNSNSFYDSNLKIMTENGYNVSKKCFKAIKVNGLRESETKIVNAEIDEVFNILTNIINNGYKNLNELKNLDLYKEPPSIGILSFLTNQKNKIKEFVYDKFDNETINKYKIFVATAEEFQGNERDIMFITLGLDGTNSWSKAFYENKNRFNVATSRAKYFTYLVFGGIPQRSRLIKDYLMHFGYSISEDDLLNENENIVHNQWLFNTKNIESEFELQVNEYLQEYIKNRPEIKIYNQVNACGQKRLDFVLYNQKTKISCAIEVDGKSHFDRIGIKYNESHIQRDLILRRAGWQIVNIKYYNWYDNGWLCKLNSPHFQEEVNRIYSELDKYLYL